MNEHQRIDAALCDKPGGNNRLAEGRRRRQHTDLICGMNRCLLDAAIQTAGETGFDVRLEPEEGLCCVKLHTR